MSISDKKFIQYINVAEFEPFANFWALSAKTVPSTFSTDINSATGSLINISHVPNATRLDRLGSRFYYISGYAPNLTIWFQDSSEAHTFPISSYSWNFGDSYNEGPADITDPSSNYYTITNVQILSGDFEHPCWITDKQYHTATHTYIMPGAYDVTLTVKASCTSTQDVCARYIDSIENEQHFYVYLEEILPNCNNSIRAKQYPNVNYTDILSSISGTGNILTYFNASGIIAGSFPICRIDWNFGNGNIQTVTRYPSISITNQGYMIESLSAYPNDPYDPRNMIIPYLYSNNTTLEETFNISLTAYACNTNTNIVCEGNSPIGPLLPAYKQRIDGDRKLIGSRFDDNGNLIYILEGKPATASTYSLHTVVLSSSVFNSLSSS